ncbi:MAG: MarR family winged helix-turn-helix transcriptional regulator [Candidatus Izemoplasmataceae bacterium]
MESLKTITILFRAQKSLENLIKNDIKKYGLNPTEFGVLEAIYHKGPLSIKEITKKVLIANSSMSYVIETLLKKAYISKTATKKDKRKFIIDLMPLGKKLMDEVYPKHQNKLRSILNSLTLDEEESLQAYLKVIGKKGEA